MAPYMPAKYYIGGVRHMGSSQSLFYLGPECQDLALPLFGSHCRAPVLEGWVNFRSRQMWFINAKPTIPRVFGYPSQDQLTLYFPILKVRIPKPFVRTQSFKPDFPAFKSGPSHKKKQAAIKTVPNTAPSHIHP